MNIRPFHVAFPVTDLEATRTFYANVLGCKVGRSAERWIDFDFYHHQISAHLVDGPRPKPATNHVDGKDVPVLHWGVILTMQQWNELAERLTGHGVSFIIEPYIRFKGELGEQATMFFLDPSGNALEFKAFANDASIFAT
ncbi:MAG TPA: VOC family protein [Bacteroidia bacterium]|jgi:extradiol dioxygenase family protein|nr:VOC family protein [Bacteroidia bacterium]